MRGNLEIFMCKARKGKERERMRSLGLLEHYGKIASGAFDVQYNSNT